MSVAVAPRWLGVPARRRLVARLCTLLGLVGVPVAVVMATGGPSTIAFWIIVPVFMVTAVFQVALLSLVFLPLLIPIGWAVDKLTSGRGDGVVTLGSAVLGIVFWWQGFQAEPLPAPPELSLPTHSPHLGALIVVLAASGAIAGLMSLSDRLREGKPVTHEPEPEETYWSFEPVVGWRAWRWDSRRLHGVMACWETSEFIAECEHCPTPPGWSHTCGVYAVMSRGEVQRFPSPWLVVGTAELWGDVIEHERGYRASHARITRLWAPSESLAAQLRAAYPDVTVTVGRTTMEGALWPT